MKKLILDFIAFYPAFFILYLCLNGVNNSYDPNNIILGFIIIISIIVSYKLNVRNNYKTQVITRKTAFTTLFYLILSMFKIIYKIFPFAKKYSFNQNEFYFYQTAEVFGYKKAESNFFNTIYFTIVETFLICLFYFLLILLIDKLYNLLFNKRSIFFSQYKDLNKNLLN